MPELPEVETVRQGLMPALNGARLSDVTLYRANLRYPFDPNFKSRLDGASVTKLERRAKYLMLSLDTDDILVVHLGMTGRFQINNQSQGDYYHYKEGDLKHRHVSFVSHKGNQSYAIDYFDPRRFGFMLLYTRPELEAQNWHQTLGVEPLSEALNVDYLYERFSKLKAPLKALLMRQDIIAGLGNIYVCEALFAAKLHPDLKGSDLNRAQAETLTQSIKSILKDAVAKGGSTISDFAATDGELGYFQHQFKVYDRRGMTCLRPECAGTIEKAVHQGRSTFFCAVCQK